MRRGRLASGRRRPVRGDQQPHREVCVPVTADFGEIGGRLDDLRRDPRIYYNSAAPSAFRAVELLLLEMRLTDGKSAATRSRRCLHHGRARPAQQMIAYLGELIAAQNYIEEPFTPFLIVGRVDAARRYEFVEVPLFEVRRGIAPEPRRSPSCTKARSQHLRPDIGSHSRRDRYRPSISCCRRCAPRRREKLPKVQTLGIVASSK